MVFVLSSRRIGSTNSSSYGLVNNSHNSPGSTGSSSTSGSTSSVSPVAVASLAFVLSSPAVVSSSERLIKPFLFEIAKF